jgi:hypothetical protein
VAPGGESITIPPLPFGAFSYFTISAGIDWVRNPSSLEGNENVPGDPDIVISMAIAGDGKSYVHAEHRSATTTGDWSDWLLWFAGIEGSAYARYQDNRYKVDDVH